MGVLESRLVIRAVDETGPAFAAIEAHLKRLSQGVAAASRSVGATGQAIGQASIAREAVRRTNSGMGALAGAASAAAGLAATYGGTIAARAAIKAVASRQHEMVRMAVSGMSPGDIADATSAAAKLSAEFPSVGQTDLMHMLRNARSIVGSYAEAAEIAEPLVKLRTLAQLARPGEDVTEDFDQLIKGLEIKGVTQDPKKFQEYMEGIAKGINVFGDTLKPYQYYEMFKYGRQATSGLSEKFILGTAPTLAQELGGSSYGRAVSAFNKSIVGGVLDTKAVDEFYRLGLLKDDDVKTLRSGHKQIKAGHYVAGSSEAQSDPNAWVKDYLIPAMEKIGLKDQADVLREVSVLFQNQMAGQMVGLLATQQSRIDKDMALLGNAQGLSAADMAIRKDPELAWQGLKASIQGLIGSVGQSVDAASGMTSTAQAIARYAAALEEEKKAQDAGRPSPAIDKTNRALNRLIFGADTPDFNEAKEVSRRRQADSDYQDRLHELRVELDDVNARLNSGSGADRKIAGVHLDRIKSDYIHARDEWESDVKVRGEQDYEKAERDARAAKARGDDGPFGGSSVGTKQQYVDAALREANIRVFGEAQVQVQSTITVEPSPELRATIANARQVQTLSVPLSGPTGGMGGDAAPRRGGLATGGSYSP